MVSDKNTLPSCIEKINVRRNAPALLPYTNRKLIFMRAGYVLCTLTENTVCDSIQPIRDFTARLLMFYLERSINLHSSTGCLHVTSANLL